MLAIRNKQIELHVTPGEECKHVIDDESYPEWGDCPAILIAPQISLRCPVYCEGRSVVLELNALDCTFPQLSCGFSVSVYWNREMHRVASGYLRRQKK